MQQDIPRQEIGTTSVNTEIPGEGIFSVLILQSLRKSSPGVRLGLLRRSGGPWMKKPGARRTGSLFENEPANEAEFSAGLLRRRPLFASSASDNFNHEPIARNVSDCS